MVFRYGDDGRKESPLYFDTEEKTLGAMLPRSSHDDCGVFDALLLRALLTI